jgi:hypothetical protein
VLFPLKQLHDVLHTAVEPEKGHEATKKLADVDPHRPKLLSMLSAYAVESSVSAF